MQSMESTVSPSLVVFYIDNGSVLPSTKGPLRHTLYLLRDTCKRSHGIFWGSLPFMTSCAVVTNSRSLLILKHLSQDQADSITVSAGISCAELWSSKASMNEVRALFTFNLACSSCPLPEPPNPLGAPEVHAQKPLEPDDA